MQKFKKSYLIACWIFFILKITTNPISGKVEFNATYIDKLVHFFIFGVLVFLLIIFLEEYLIWKSLKYIIAIFLTSFVSWLVEFLQIYIPGRYDSAYDFLAGFLGAIIIVFIYHNINIFKPKILVHICCAGCGAHVGQILSKNYRVILFFYNPGIFPEKEYRLRLKEIKKVGRIFAFKTIEGEYNHFAWQKKVSGHEKDFEGGDRCRICYEDRLEKTAVFAIKHKIKFFTSTLTVSPHKKADIIFDIGSKLEKKYKLNFLQQDFKKMDGFKKASVLSKKLNLYRQDYCGCEYSRKFL